MKTALLVVDMQEAFRNIDLCKKSFESTLPHIALAIKRQRVRNEPIIFTRTAEAQKLGIEGGYELIKNLDARGSDKVIDKEFPNSFWMTSLEQSLRGLGVSSVVVCGCFALSCVYLTHNGALERGFRSSVLNGGVISSSEDSIDLLHVLAETIILKEDGS